MPPADVRRQLVAESLAERLVDPKSTVDGTVQEPHEPHDTKEARIGAVLDVFPHPAHRLPDRRNHTSYHVSPLATYTTPSRTKTG